MIPDDEERPNPYLEPGTATAYSLRELVEIADAWEPQLFRIADALESIASQMGNLG